MRRELPHQKIVALSFFYVSPVQCRLGKTSDYAETLKRWRLAFHAEADAVRGLGFDERFMRIWHFYLAYCEAGFHAGSIDVAQFRLEHAA
ncbi:MAG: class I SAM-dependent methyltransferase [Thiobacillus sp.]|nr:class I SAM-dependent methyltransferase [Thiobacillus sp.]